MKTTTQPAPTRSLVHHYNFDAVRVATKTHVFIGILNRAFDRLPAIDAIEVYRIGRDHYTETFVGYADGEQARRLRPALAEAARLCKIDERFAPYR